MSTDHRPLSSILYLLPLAWLWFTLINHLRVEWSVNPQYAYGWAVPFLCVYLLWRRWHGTERQAEGREEGTDTSPWPFLRAGRRGNAFCALLLVVCALLYLPTRLIEEANPEWRLVSWALAFEVIGLTLLLIHLAGGEGRGARGQSSFLSIQLSAFRFSDFVFPLCFFLVAVPWPTVIEGPLIQGLMRANVGTTIEVLGVIGVPAFQHGNVIEIATGMVGIDDACSGIRSFQAVIMLSLFFGELYALSASRRAVCVFAGFALAFGFNVGRTLLLTLVASAKGVGAVASWHDPAGVTILVACFLCLWLIARALRGGRAETLKSSPALRSSSRFSVSAFQLFSICLTAWLVLVEGGTELYYRSHEWRLPENTVWHVQFPRDNPSFRELPFSDKTKQFLRYDQGSNGTWQQGNDQRWQAIFFRWNPGRIAVHLAKSHTPEVCLTAAGRELVSQSGPRTIDVHGLQLPFQSYVVKDESGPLHVFYCLWEDRASVQSFSTTTMTYANRLAPVLAGRRNSGERSLEVAIWGIPDAQDAEAALARELEKLVSLGK